ncbi:MAG TPA: LysR family transcriptional regulator [Propionibacteriaceae bacterium]|jgi:DNA-binding transcriptional LysR family regulator|nr:LysR family transcriptional regulator [Micropruina sp.]HBY22981.1 LysR family transcriptional regulator [Propionibacteriaceae bacterium]
MDVRHLDMLRELGALGSVTAVAERLQLTPSAVSQQLRQLQRQVGVPLAERSGRRLVLTEAGHTLAKAAEQVGVALAGVDRVAAELAGRPVGRVSVAAFNSAALAFFPRLLRAHAQGSCPEVELTDEDVPQAQFAPLATAVDVVIAHRLDHTPPWPGSVSALPLLHEPLDVAVPSGHPLAGRDWLDPDDVADQPWITTHDGFPLLATLDAVGAVAGRRIVRAHRVNEFSIAAALVREGAGLAFIPRWTAPRPDGVVLIPLRGGALRHVDALFRPERAQRPAVQAVLRLLVALAAEIRGASEASD